MGHPNKNVIETHQNFRDDCFCHKQGTEYERDSNVEENSGSFRE